MSTAAWLSLLVAGVALTWWLVLRAEPGRLARECSQRYAAAKTTAESVTVDQLIPERWSRLQRTGPLTCRSLRLHPPSP